MNPRDLPIVGRPRYADSHDFFGHYADLRGKKLLCIGLSETEAAAYLLPHAPASITLLTNWEWHPDAKASQFELVIGDITQRTPFDDDAFDAVLTLSVLEHLGDLAAAFREMSRLVRSGGAMLHMFGPAWSCAYGHHLHIDADDPHLNFSYWTMPAHMHLLCSPAEIERYYLELGYPAATVAHVLGWFYESPIINRRFSEEYVAQMRAPHLRMQRMELMSNALPADHLDRLKAACPTANDFTTYGGRYHLTVSKC